MKIIIVGGGQVGATLAEYLVFEQHEITVIDIDRTILNDLSARLDLATVLGSGSFPSVLDEAGCADADALIAVSNDDETNMLACQVAFTLFKTPLKIARIRSQQFHAYKELFKEDAIPIDVIITPELIVRDFIISLIQYPGAHEIADFANNKAKLVIIKITKNSILYNKSLADVKDILHNINYKLVTCSLENIALMNIKDDYILQENVEIAFLVSTIEAHVLLQALQPQVRFIKNIMIVGGGNIGYSLAKGLDKHYNVKILEHNKDRCLFLAEKLQRSLVLRGEAADRELLIDENIAEIDLFCALTNNDGVNIISSLLARHLGADKVLALITRDIYVDIMQDSAIDISISPQEVTLSAVLKYIRRGDIEQVYSMNEGHSEVIEMIMHGTEATSQVIGRTASEIVLPKDSRIIAIVRNNKIFFDLNNIMVEPLDHIIIFIADKKEVTGLEKLFKVDITYI